MTPDSTRRLDIIIFGASGYSGKIVTQEMMKINKGKFSWAIAGRDSEKLKIILSTLGLSDLETPIIIADCYNKGSLDRMAEQSRVIINCCGPYRFFGKPVVEACIRNGTHYVDLSGEPEYMESIQLEAHEDAVKNECYIVNACTLDGVPADFGIIYLEKHFSGLLNSVESFLLCSYPSKEPGGNTGTWKSLVHSLANIDNLRAIRPKVFAVLNQLELKPRLKARTILHKCPVFHGKFSTPFVASDKTVVLRSQQFFYTTNKKRPVQYQPYYVFSSYWDLFAVTFMSFFLFILGKIKFGRDLLIRYPRFFSCGKMGQGPSEESRINSYALFKFVGQGWSINKTNYFHSISSEVDEDMDLQVSFDVHIQDFGYGFSARSVIMCAFTILEESEQMPLTGGVYTPAAAFSRTSFLDKLPQTGLIFQNLSQQSIS